MFSSGIVFTGSLPSIGSAISLDGFAILVGFIAIESPLCFERRFGKNPERLPPTPVWLEVELENSETGTRCFLDCF